MTFREQYSDLERDFQEQVERDNKEKSLCSSYVPNRTPSGPVDYVLIAMEPSKGQPGKDIESSEIARNFSWSVEDFILHYCVREYLCQGGETYHLTDLAKGGMTTTLADKDRWDRYERWYPLLQKELKLLGKDSGTRIIAIGKVVAEFLGSKGLCKRVERVLHYSPQMAPHREKAIRPWREHFDEFCRTVDKEAFNRSIEAVLRDADMASYIGHRPQGREPRPGDLTPSRMKLMFYYKNRFGEIRNSSDSILRL